MAVGELADELGRRPELSLEDVAFTLQVGRNAHKYRAVLVTDSLADARSQLDDGSPVPAPTCRITSNALFAVSRA